MPQRSTGGAVMRNGLIFGAIIAALGLGNVVFRWLTGGYVISSQLSGGVTSVNFTPSKAAVAGCLLFLATLGLTFVAGMLTARKSGRVGGSSLTGLLAGAVGALVSGVVSFVIILMILVPGMQPPANSPLTQSQYQASVDVGVIIALIGTIILYGGFGAGLGALGGLVGRNSYLKANPPQPYPGTFYPGAYPGGPWQPGAYYPAAPYPGPQYPAYPPYPMYPAPPYAAPAGPQYPAPPEQPLEPQPPQQG